MTNQHINSQTKKPKSNKMILIILGVILSLCVICVIFSVIYSQTPQGKAAAIENSQKSTLAAMVKTMAPKQENAPAQIPAPTDIPIPTPLPMLGMDLSQFVAKYDSMTDIQKKEFVGQSIGKWVNWSGLVREVMTDGTVIVDIPETLASAIYLKGVPKDVGISLQKGMQINFTGRISDVNEFLGLHLYIDNTQVIQ